MSGNSAFDGIADRYKNNSEREASHRARVESYAAKQVALQEAALQASQAALEEQRRQNEQALTEQQKHNEQVVLLAQEEAQKQEALTGLTILDHFR